ncbi:Small nuclear ribonucleoprotein Sm D-like protein [Geodia barretti]|uniref:Small nuclear ribonucleoprotein Sm D-like protein n=1 Tax=Geodia barretti TaxID=519541 RepID=A0AA35S9U6_GEOBA|nr:Small nuclear ribonucleoprotein Sm D-like protein [Geodia barretti]
MQQDNSPDPSLDFLSSQFSAEKALVTSPSKIQLPYPEVQPCDNLEQYASVVRGTSRKPPSQSAACSRGQLQEQPRKQGARAAVPLSSRQRLVRTVKSVISTMESPTSGPLCLVQRCREERVRVKVVVRHCAGVRGECEGTVLAFDQHLNLVLGDVSERFSPLRTVANGGLQPRSQRRRQRHKTTPAQEPAQDGGQYRHLDKLFVRGDNVVLLSPVCPLSQTIPPVPFEKS